MIANIWKPSPITYLFNTTGMFCAYSYIAFLIYKFAIP